jgi:hypothetical protein
MHYSKASGLIFQGSSGNTVDYKDNTAPKICRSLSTLWCHGDFMIYNSNEKVLSTGWMFFWGYLGQCEVACSS